MHVPSGAEAQLWSGIEGPLPHTSLVSACSDATSVHIPTMSTMYCAFQSTTSQPSIAHFNNVSIKQESLYPIVSPWPNTSQKPLLSTAYHLLHLLSFHQSRFSARSSALLSMFGTFFASSSSRPLESGIDLVMCVRHLLQSSLRPRGGLGSGPLLLGGRQSLLQARSSSGLGQMIFCAS